MFGNTVKPAMRDHPMGPEKVVLYDRWSSLEVQMYRNVEPCYCNSGLSLEVGLSSQWFLIIGFNVDTLHCIIAILHNLSCTWVKRTHGHNSFIE